VLTSGHRNLFADHSPRPDRVATGLLFLFADHEVEANIKCLARYIALDVRFLLLDQANPAGLPGRRAVLTGSPAHVSRSSASQWARNLSVSGARVLRAKNSVTTVSPPCKSFSASSTRISRTDDASRSRAWGTAPSAAQFQCRAHPAGDTGFTQCPRRPCVQAGQSGKERPGRKRAAPPTRILRALLFTGDRRRCLC
jgi:hypothetical protein